jgi:hypothetical protein
MHKSTVNGKHEANIPSEVMKLGRDLGFSAIEMGSYRGAIFQVNVLPVGISQGVVLWFCP